jgi:uncharacterized protein YndB with AHSA1/START domain
MGTLHTIDGKPVLRFERMLNHPPEKVWHVVSDPAEMAHWFPAQVRTELRAGAPMEFDFGDPNIEADRFSEGEILEFDPPKVYAFRWFDSVLRFELVPDGAGCRLYFSHTLSGVPTWGDTPSAGRNASGWETCLDMLAARVAGIPAPGTEAAAFLHRMEGYIEEFGLARGEIREIPEGYEIRFERDLVAGPDVVWSTVLGNAEPVLGGAPPARLTEGQSEPGVITEVTPQRLIEYRWPGDETAGSVRFEPREQEPIGTRLVVTQVLPRSLADRRADTLAAWQVRLELLFAALHREVRAWPADRAEELLKQYADRL